MKNDITFHKVEDIYLAVTRLKNDLGAYEWHVRIINKKQEPIHNILITSKGYGIKDGIEQKTSVLRHHIEEVLSGNSAIIESIDPSVFHLNNEYWVSYYIQRQIFDKKFIFVPDSITENNLSKIDILEMEGVLHP